MLEPKNNPNPKLLVDPPNWLRRILRGQFDKMIDPEARRRRREKHENKRKREGRAHIVDYFHQFDDPYCHLTAQILKAFAERYDIELRPHLIRAAGGKNQPELERLRDWARLDAEMIAPHYGLQFPSDAGRTPDNHAQRAAAALMADRSPAEFVNMIAEVSDALWSAHGSASLPNSETPAADDAIEIAYQRGAKRLAAVNHYSGGVFHYGGECYWGVDRLFYLEERLRELGVGEVSDEPYLAPRPAIDVDGVDARQLTLDFYPSLNSPYTYIIYDKTIALKNACGIAFNHKPVLPMIMRGVTATRAKGAYIMFDTKREAEYLGVPFGPVMTPIGDPTRRAYALLPWAREQGKDEALMSALLKCAFSGGIPLYTEKGFQRGVEMAGLDWATAKTKLDDDHWKVMVEGHQDDMVEGLGLWGVPCYRLSGGDEPDLSVWGQDRLWLIAAEIRRRAGANPKSG